jgi:N-succinyldiaminopimelate aminotransferase
MNPDLKKTQPYPFERLATLKAGVTPPTHLLHIALSIGEPKHAPPPFVLEVIKHSLAGYSAYPTTAGNDELRDTCARWLERRFGLGADAVHRANVLPVSGTREALFAFAQAAIDRSATGSSGAPLVAMPNPFYQIYEGAALLAGAEPYFIETPASNNFLPDLEAVPASVWDRVQLLYLCSPGNPGGAVMNIEAWRRVLALAERHDFLVASDECYTELYPDESNPPPSLLSAAIADGRSGFERCVVFHSLSKRSSLPGLRSGFVAGDASLLESFLRYRTYHGCSLPLPTQAASIAAWRDEAHVIENRRLYREKFAKVMPLLAPHLDFTAPEGGFYLWADTRDDDEVFVRELFARENVTVVPGSYLARTVEGRNPGAGRLRISLVASVDECVEAATRIARFAASR